jgi:sporulation protein YlmC with PRC-barrel domain
MPNDVRIPDTSELSYLDASKVISPAGALSELDVLNTEGRRLGSIEGVVIDAAARHVRYLFVRTAGWLGRQYLVRADQLGQIEGERKALRLFVDLKNVAVHGLDVAALRKFSDDDLLAAIFAPRTA